MDEKRDEHKGEKKLSKGKSVFEIAEELEEEEEVIAEFIQKTESLK